MFTSESKERTSSLYQVKILEEMVYRAPETPAISSHSHRTQTRESGQLLRDNPRKEFITDCVSIYRRGRTFMS